MALTLALATDTQTIEEPNRPGAPTSESQKQPSLTPEQIWQFSQRFYDENMPLYRLWYVCTEAVTGFRKRYGLDMQGAAGNRRDEMSYFMRARDISFNLTQPLLRNVLSRLSVEMPGIGVVPATDAPDDVAAAQATEQVARYHWREGKLKRVIMDAVGWAAMHGTAGIVTSMVGSDVRDFAFAPERLRAEPGLGDPNESRFLGLTRVTTRDVLKRQFPDKVYLIDQARRPEYSPTSPYYGMQMAEDRVEVLEAYCRSGHWYILVGDQVLAQGQTPGCVMPIQVLRYTAVPGQFFGMGVVEMCLPAQYAFSSMMNQIIQNARLMSNPKVLIERSSKIDPGAFTSRVGENVLYTGVKPDVWTPPALPQYMQQVPPQMQSIMFDMAGIHGVSTGKRQVGITSGRAVEAMTANDTAQLTTTMDNVEAVVEDLLKVDVLYMRAYYPEDKFIRQFDPANGKPVFATIHKAQLCEDPEVFFEAGTLFSSEVKDRDARTLDMLRLGLIDPEDAKKKLSTHTDPLTPLRLIGDMQSAKRALAALIDNGPVLPDGRETVKVFPTDNLKVWLDVFNAFMNAAEFQELPPDRQDAIEGMYLKMLQLTAPPDPAAMAGGGTAKQPPGVPKPNSVLPSSPTPEYVDQERAVSAQTDAAEAADEHTQ